MVDDKKKYAEMFETIKGQRQALIRMLKSPEGRLAVDFLAEKYGGDVQVKNDPYATHVRIGERNVIDYLIELREGEDG